MVKELLNLQKKPINLKDLNLGNLKENIKLNLKDLNLGNLKENIKSKT